MMEPKPARKSRTIWHTWISFAVDSGLIAMLVAADWRALGIPPEIAAGVALGFRLAGAGLAHWLRLQTTQPIEAGK